MKINIDAEKLLIWFGNNKKNYPWAAEKTPYLVWISEIMLQQTVAASVIPYFERWRKDFPDIVSLAEADPDTVLSHWEGLGYYSRCRNLHKAARYIRDEYSGIIPRTLKELKSIPGIGDYTARALLSIAFSRPYAVLDANVRRIVQRLSAQLDWSADLDKKTIEELEKIIPPDRPGEFNEAMMQLGQIVCTSASPRCRLCPVKENCGAFIEGLTGQIPLKKRKIINTVQKKIHLFYSDGAILLGKKKKGVFFGLWLIPANEEDSYKSLEALEEKFSAGKKIALKKRNHFYTDNKDMLTPLLFVAETPDLPAPTPEDNELYSYRWIGMDELDRHPSPSVYRKILDEAREHLRKKEFSI